MKWIFFLSAFLFFTRINAQNNLSWLKINRYKVSELGEALAESSGLVLFKNYLLSINDSGNTSEIFEIDKKTGKIINKIQTNLQNQDWEAITTDGSNIYIADTGNNLGSRKDFKIYKLNVDEQLNIIDRKKINFHFPEQTDFSEKPYKHNFDAEALAFDDGNLHLFSKEWNSLNVSHYQISPNEENQSAKLLETMRLGYLVTDACIYDGKLYLIGYTKKTGVYLSVFQEDSKGLFFNSIPKKYYLGKVISLGQIEGLAVDETGVYISAERFRKSVFSAEQKLFFISAQKTAF